MQQLWILFTEPRPWTRKFISARLLAFVYSDQQERLRHQAKSDRCQVERRSELVLLLCWWLFSFEVGVYYWHHHQLLAQACRPGAPYNQALLYIAGDHLYCLQWLDKRKHVGCPKINQASCGSWCSHPVTNSAKKQKVATHTSCQGCVPCSGNLAHGRPGYSPNYHCCCVKCQALEPQAAAHLQGMTPLIVCSSAMHPKKTFKHTNTHIV